MRNYFKELKMNMQRIAKAKAQAPIKKKKFKEDKVEKTSE